MKTKIPTYIYVLSAVILAVICTFVLYLFLPKKQKITQIEEKNNTNVQQIDPTKDLPQPFIDENNPPPTVAVQKVDLVPITPITKELEDAIIKTEKDIDTADGKETKLSE